MNVYMVTIDTETHYFRATCARGCIEAAENWYIGWVAPDDLQPKDEQDIRRNFRRSLLECVSLIGELEN